MPELPFLDHLTGLKPVPHGGAAQLAARGVDPVELDDFSASILAIRAPASVRRALAAADHRAYPDPTCTELRAALGRLHGLPADHILCANGSVELIVAVARATLRPRDSAIVVGPTFGEYAQAVALTGARPVELRTTSIEVVLEGIAVHAPRLVFLCNPNTPTGHRGSEGEVDRLADDAPLVLDEAYAGFLRPAPMPAWGPGRLVLRSLTKDRAMAGLRLGYAVAPPESLHRLSLMLTPWGVNQLAQRAALAALAEAEPYERAIAALWAERARLVGALRAARLPVEAGAAPFFLVEVEDATATVARLLDQGIVVRDCSSFGLPRHIRVSPQDPAAGDRLVAALSGRPIPPRALPGRLHVVLGGARSGKSRHAEQLAAGIGGMEVTYLATAESRDEEMDARIQRHRLDRPAAWQTLEEPLRVAEALGRAAHPTVLLDCITLLASNLLLAEDEDRAVIEIERLIATARARSGTLIVVSNEVGAGIVPDNALARRFRDLQGTLNRLLTHAADEATLVVAGQPISLKEPT